MYFYSIFDTFWSGTQYFWDPGLESEIPGQDLAFGNGTALGSHDRCVEKMEGVLEIGKNTEIEVLGCLGVDFGAKWVPKAPSRSGVSDSGPGF